MTRNTKYVCLFVLVASCAPKTEMLQYGQHYQKFNDFKSLTAAVKLMPEDITTSQVKEILGEPIDNGFDYDKADPEAKRIRSSFRVLASGSLYRHEATDDRRSAS